MKTLFAMSGTIAGLLSASSLFAQTPGDSYQLSAYRPGATYYAESTVPDAKLWAGSATNVSYNPTPAAMPTPDQAYSDALEGHPGMMPIEGGYIEQGAPCNAGSGGSACSDPGAMYGGSEVVGTYGEYGTVFSNGAGYGCPEWFVYAGGLIMDRDDEREVWLSNDGGDFSARVMGSRDAAMDWSGGYELRLGRRFACSNWAWSVNYWAVRGESDFTVTSAGLVGALDTPLDANFQGLSYNDGTGLSNLTAYYNNASVHQLQRSFDFYNVEVNLFQDPTIYAGNCGCSSFNVGFIGGIRYFKFSEGMDFATDYDADGVIDGDASEVHYGIDTDNNLVGPQIGFIGNLNAGCWDLYCSTKFGLFGNHINHSSRVFGATGDAVIDNALSPNNGQAYNVNSSRADYSFLGEIDLGGSYRFGKHFKAVAGYRAVAITGVALSTDQIPQNFEDLQIVADIQSSGEVVLHGGYFGGEFSW